MAQMNRLTGIACERFTYVKGERTLVAEASDLGRNPFSRIYPDAMDYGLAVNGRSGQVVFYVASEEKRDGDLVAWHLFPTPESVRRVPAAAGLRMTIFND